ncbi:MAG: Crp/Fnr family transcriptional regulator [Deinococcales bacterium]
MDDVRAALERSALFVGAPESAIKMALEAVTTRTFSPGAEIFREDDPGEAVYLIVEGRVKVSRANLEGRERIFTILASPEILGEMALVSSGARSATARCLDRVVALVIYREDLKGILDRNPAVLWNLTKILAKRLGDMNREVEVLSSASTTACVAYALQALYLRGGFKSDKDGLPTLEFTHQDLANRSGNSRETITRALKDFEKEGIIKTRPGMITLLKPEALEAIIFGLRDDEE